MEEINEWNCYQVGETFYFRELSKEEYKHMLHLVAYDIRSPKRLHKIAKICEDYGIRVEYSVFECDLTPEIFQLFWTRLNNTIDKEEDTILAYKFCKSCVNKIESMGPVVRPGKILAYIF